MRQALKKKIHFKLEQRTDKDTGKIITANVPVNMVVTFSGQRLTHYTGLRCDKDNWNPAKERISKGKDVDTGNKILNALENLIIEIFDDYEDYPSVAKLREDIRNGIQRPEKPQAVSEYFNQYMQTESVEKSWRKTTIDRVKCCGKHLALFNPDLTFADLTRKTLLEFKQYQEELPLMNTTIEKNFKILRGFLKWAKINGHNKNIEYETFRPKFDGMRNRDRVVIALDWQELMGVYHFDIPASKVYLSQVRDVFCFQCFTGLRFSDVYNLTRANIRDGRIEYVTQKTNDPLSVPLNDYSRAILDKYANFVFEGNKVLPVISNQRMNDYLKELGQMAGLTGEQTVIHYTGTRKITHTMPKYELLTSHVGRRTFVSIGSYLNIPYEIMASWTGHSSETMMARYRAINSGKATSEMNKLNMVTA